MIERAFGIKIVILALLCGIFGASFALIADPLGADPLLVPAGGVAIGAGLGLWLRGREIIEVLACAFLTLFAYYMGFGTVLAEGFGFTPILFVGAAGYAILIAVLVAYPVSLIPSRTPKPRARDAAFLKYIGERDKQR